MVCVCWNHFSWLFELISGRLRRLDELNKKNFLKMSTWVFVFCCCFFFRFFFRKPGFAKISYPYIYIYIYIYIYKCVYVYVWEVGMCMIPFYVPWSLNTSGNKWEAIVLVKIQHIYIYIYIYMCVCVCVCVCVRERERERERENLPLKLLLIHKNFTMFNAIKCRKISQYIPSKK